MKHGLAVVLILLACSSLAAEPKHRVVDKKFWITVGALTASAFVDGYSSHRCIASHSCIEWNPFFGKTPGNPRIILEGGALIAAESVTLSYVKKLDQNEKAWGRRNLWLISAAAATAAHGSAAYQNMQVSTARKP